MGVTCWAAFSYAFSYDQPSTLYKEVFGYCTYNIDIEIESRVTLLKFEWVLCETCSPSS